MKYKRIFTLIPLLFLAYLSCACSPVTASNNDDRLATAILQILEQSAVPAISPSETPVPALQSLPDCIPPNQQEIAHVTEITDGDTIHVWMDGQEYAVRYIGIDTPETSDGASAEAAKDANSRLVMDRDVILVKDVSNTDQYDRLLRYVIIGEVFVNQQMVVDGLATAKEYPPDTACNSEFRAAQSTAQASQLGIWAAAAIPMPEQKVATIAVGENSTAGNCEPSYPGVCIPPSPPDLDCGDVSFRRFQVIPPDPHHFDMDGDGIGCEGK